MRSTLESALPWWIAGPVLGLVIAGARWRIAREAHEPQLPVMQGADVL